ncbi:LysR family transcriptional regulator [Ramlibacter sp. AN1015]|uniref:LysR family transcriptional regulator n=1 Tax=Ramlibacter sp. AN1015 TaxID=3133428 RepID=UPI0030C12821
MRASFVDLQVFLHACECGSMTAAAERACLTVAAVSARLRRLEETAGVPLLRRHARGVEATAAGEALALHARRVLQEVDRLEQRLRAGRPRRATLLLANTAALGAPLTPLAGWLAEHAGAARLTVRESTSEATVRALQAQLADVGIVSDAVSCEGLRVQPLGPDPLVVVTARGHPLAHRAQVCFSEVLEHEWVAWGDDTALGLHLAMQAHRLGKPLRRRFTFTRADDILALVAQGWGLSVVPAAGLSQQEGTAALVSVPLAQPWAQRTLLVCMDARSSDTAALAVFEGVRRLWLQRVARTAPAYAAQR